MLGRVLKKVFRERALVAWALVLFLLFIFFIILLPNFTLVGIVLQEAIPPSEKISFFLGLAKGLPMSMGWLQTIFTLITGLLFGMNISMSIFYVRQSGRASLHNLKSLSGLLVALLGLGCASCGALFLAPVLGTSLATGLALVPGGGATFSLVGIALLLWSAYAVAGKIDNPYV